MSIALVLVLVLVALVVLAAVLAAAEVALLRVPEVSVAVEAESGNRRARVMAGLLDDLPLVLNSVLLTALLVQVSAATLSGYLAQRWFGGLATTIAAVLVTLALFVYSEAIPKTLAVRAPLRFGLALARPVAIVAKLASPLTRVLLWAADAQTPGTGASARTAFSEHELRRLAEESAEAGEIEPADAELVKRSFEFGDTTVGDVLVSRDDIVAVPADSTPEAALEAAVAAGHRRLPVYERDLDSIVGVIRVRDVAAAAQTDEPATVRPLARSTLRATTDMPVADALRRMQATGLRFGIVTDTTGATVGIVTVEDIVAELVGEIEDIN